MKRRRAARRLLLGLGLVLVLLGGAGAGSQAYADGQGWRFDRFGEGWQAGVCTGMSRLDDGIFDKAQTGFVGIADVMAFLGLHLPLPGRENMLDFFEFAGIAGGDDEGA